MSGIDVVLIITLLGAGGGVWAMIKDFYSIRSKIARNTKIRKALWYLTNKKICVQINVNKVYSPFELMTNEVMDVIEEKVRTKFGRYIDPPMVMDNRFQFVAEKMSAPIAFVFDLDINIEEDKIEGISVQCKVLGNLTFVYREFKNYIEVLRLIEEIYYTIEEIHKLQKPIYTNYFVKATIFDIFEEDWSVKREVKIDDAEIKVGSKIVWANSRTITPLFDLGKYILMLP